ncbi:SRPBCC family protein, partial [Nocardia niigatensis]
MPKTDGHRKATAHTIGRVADTVGRAGATAGKTATSAPTGLLQQSVQNLAGTVAERAVAGLANQVSRTAERLNDYADGSGGGNLLAAVTGVEKLAGGASPLQAVMSAGTSKLGH